MKSQQMQETMRWVGRVLRDKWRIDARIARGGVGTVFSATHKNNGNRVAIKVLHPNFSRDEDTRGRFLQEGYAANQVNHPGVVRILDDDVTEEGLAFLVMELLEGELLEKRRVRKGGRLPLPEVYEIADQLLDVLAAAHDKGIVHRDIKPDNLFLTRQGRLKVLDFGFAQMKRGFRKEQTATGFLLGTPGFMAPEQAIGNRAQMDAQTDIWAVGATLFTLVSSHPVHRGGSAAEMLVAAANFPARSLRTADDTVPAKLVEIVDRALAFDKKARWPSARAMQAALRGDPSRVRTGFESSRRSIPDPIEILDPNEENTDLDVLEQHDPRAAEDPRLAFQRTVKVERFRGLPDGALPSVRRPFEHGEELAPDSSHHAADDEMATVAVGSPSSRSPVTVPAPAPSQRPSSPSRPRLDSTLVMENGPGAHLGRTGSGAYAALPSNPSVPAAPVAPSSYRAPQSSFHPATPQEFAPVSAPMSGPLSSQRLPQSTATPGQKPTNRVVLFLGVALLSMFLVVAMGSAVIFATH